MKVEQPVLTSLSASPRRPRRRTGRAVGRERPVKIERRDYRDLEFEVRGVKNLREHYARTLPHWAQRLYDRWEEAIRLVSEAVYPTWRLYMSFSALGFEAAQINVNQSLLAKPAGGKVSLPMNRADLYSSD